MAHNKIQIVHMQVLEINIRINLAKEITILAHSTISKPSTIAIIRVAAI